MGFVNHWVSKVIAWHIIMITGPHLNILVHYVIHMKQVHFLILQGIYVLFMVLCEYPVLQLSPNLNATWTWYLAIQGWNKMVRILQNIFSVALCAVYALSHYLMMSKFTNEQMRYSVSMCQGKLTRCQNMPTQDFFVVVLQMVHSDKYIMLRRKWGGSLRTFKSLN